jgi:hypothetical protein
MTRLLLVFACLFALALGAPLGNQAAAKRGHHQSCSGMGWDGKQTRWRCGRHHKCCYDWFSGKGTCIPKSEVCL